jgi:hypothetical protein
VRDGTAAGQFASKQLAEIIIFRKSGYYRLPFLENTESTCSVMTLLKRAATNVVLLLCPVKTIGISDVITSQLLFPEDRKALEF